MWHPSNEQISALLRCKIIRMKNWYITILGWLLAWVTKRTHPESQKNGVVNWWAWTAYFPVFWSSPKATSNIWLYSSTKWTSRPSFTFSASSSKSLFVSWREYDGLYITPSGCYSFLLNLILSTRNESIVRWHEPKCAQHCSMSTSNGSQKSRGPTSLHFTIQVVIIFFEFDFRKVWNIFMPNICMK